MLLAELRPGISLYLDARDTSLTPTILRRGRWEVRVVRAIRASLREGGTFLDIGANCGYHALIAARRVGPSGTVIAIEPQQDLCRMLERSVAENGFTPFMQVLRLAIGASPGTGSLGKLPNLSGSASFCFGEDVPERESVPIVDLPTALDLVAQQAGRPVLPDVIKIDVEGFEPAVWDGMKEWTLGREALTVILEFSPFSYRSAGRDPAELLREFRDYGFALSKLGRIGVHRLGERACAAIAAGDEQVDLLLRKHPAA